MTDKKENINEEVIKEGEEIEAKSEDAVEEATEDAKPEGPGDTEEKEEKGEEKTEEKAEEKEEEGDAKYLRLMADFQNYKKRVEKEKKDLYSYANEKIMSELLAVIDNFERALEQDAGEGFKEGMEMIFKQLGDVLKTSGLEEIPALGEDFDPNVHNAVMAEETEEYESGKVSGVMQKGYTLNGKVIRPSMVKVAN
ncbi:MAG: nucleotide exchange factor GrpE [Firmicutes bacterium]|nr:nucleotide exchange factor GrpE [Bacillota bacterium]